MNYLLSIIFVLFCCDCHAQKPTAVLVNPHPGHKFVGGETLTFSGYGTDSKDGNLPDSTFQWQILMNHGKGAAQHWHDGIGYYIGVNHIQFSTPLSNDHVLGDDIFFRFRFMVTNSIGLTDTATLDVYPQLSHITITTVPEGIPLNISGYNFLPTPIEANSAVNMGLQASAEKNQSLNDNLYAFSHWSNGSNDLTTEFSIPPKDTSIIAYYTLISSTDKPLASFTPQIVPNPVINNFIVKGLNNNNIKIIICDLLSKEVKNLNANYNDLIDIADLPRGIYYVGISSNDKNYFQKIYKIN